MADSDKFLDSMKEVIDTWKEVPQTIRVIDKDITAKPSYISQIYMESDTEYSTFLNGHVDSKNSKSTNEGLSSLVMIGNEKQGFGSARSALQGFPRNPKLIKDLFHKNMDAPTKSALESYLGYVTNSISYQEENIFERLSKEEAETHLENEPEKNKLPRDLTEIIQTATKDGIKLKHVEEAQASISLLTKSRRFVDSEGRRIRQYNSLGKIVVSVDLIHNTGQEIEFGDVITFTNYDKINRDVLRQKIEDIFSYSKSLQKAPTLESDYYPVIMSGEALGTMIHEALGGHLLSGKYIVDGSSTAFKDKIGKLILPEFLSITDNPTAKGASGYYVFDDEGIRAQKTILVKDGILQNYLLDRESGFYLNQNSNGHSRMEWVISPTSNGKMGITYPEPRVSNLEIISSNSISDQELEDYARKYCKDHNKECALYIKSGAGAVDPSTGHFNLMPSKAWKIYPNGKKEIVQNFIVDGNAYELLSQIEVTSNLYSTEHGICGSDSGGIPTQETAPAAFIPHVNVQGQDVVKYTKRLLPNE